MKMKLEKKRVFYVTKTGSFARTKFLSCKTAVLCILAAAMTAVLFTITAQAAEMPDVTELSQIMTARRDVDMQAAPEESGETILSYEKGTLVFVTGETADGWYRVIYQDNEGYVPKDSLQLQEIDVEQLDAEMEQMEQEAVFVVESVEKYRVEAARSKLWGGVIISLVAGIFAVGIISGIRGAKGEGREKESDS